MFGPSKNHSSVVCHRSELQVGDDLRILQNSLKENIHCLR